MESAPLGHLRRAYAACKFSIAERRNSRHTDNQSERRLLLQNGGVPLRVIAKSATFTRNTLEVDSGMQNAEDPCEHYTLS